MLKSFPQARFIPATLALLVMLASLAPRVGSAQARSTSAKSEVSDIVMLVDGGFVRGTLVEHAPGQYAVLLTLGGQLRRFEAAEFRYAGPAAGAPQTATSDPAASVPASSTDRQVAAPAARVEPPRDTTDSVEVHFQATRPIEVFERNGISTTTSGVGTGESYAPLCTAPCVMSIRPGTVTLGLAEVGGRPLRAGSLMLRQGSMIEASYQSRFGLRVGGFIVSLGMVGAGLALMLTSIDDDGGLGGGFVGGAVLGGLGTLGMLILPRIPDSAEVHARR